jgi:signal transduction histidine kinase
MKVLRRGILRPLHVTLATSVVAGAATLLVSGLVLVDIAYRSPSLHVALETGVAVIAVVAAHLVHGRFRQRPTHGDLVLFYALAVFAVTNLLFSAMPAAVSKAYPDGLSTWAPTVGTLGATILLVWAAFASSRHASSRLRKRIDRAGAAAVIAVTIASVVILGAFGLAPQHSQFAPSRWGWHDIAGHPEVALQGLICVLFFIAGVGFARRAEADGDRLMSWLAAGSIFGAFARLNYFIFPSLYSDWIYTGDILRVCFYLLLFVGAASEIRAYQRRAAETAVLEERRRIARDLHDGLAQELAFIVAQTHRLEEAGSEAPGSTALGHLASAAERALDESRRAVAALAGPVDVAFHIALAREVEEIASRVGARIEVEVPDDLDLDPATRETLLRIVREAVGNAARHGRAGRIVVHLSNGAGLHLSIVDDGIGFDSRALSSDARFGLNSMRERAVAAGGEFRLTTSAGGGTRIEVVLP